MPPVIVDMPWPPDVGEDLLRPDGTPLTDPISGRPVRVYHDQIVVWVSLAMPTMTALPPGFPVFPIVIDTGFNDAFRMQERQAEAWMTPAVISGLTPNAKYLRIGTEAISGRDAVLWLHPNIPGAQPDLSGLPVPLRLPLGAILTPPGSAVTKEKPLLGLRAIRFNKLTLRHRREPGTGVGGRVMTPLSRRDRRSLRGAWLHDCWGGERGCSRVWQYQRGQLWK